MKWLSEVKFTIFFYNILYFLTNFWHCLVGGPNFVPIFTPLTNFLGRHFAAVWLYFIRNLFFSFIVDFGWYIYFWFRMVLRRFFAVFLNIGQYALGFHVSWRPSCSNALFIYCLEIFSFVAFRGYLDFFWTNFNVFRGNFRHFGLVSIIFEKLRVYGEFSGTNFDFFGKFFNLDFLRFVWGIFR